MFARFHADIDSLPSHMQTLSQIQLYPIDIYRTRFWAAMWLLQQTPPTPHLIVKLLLTFAEFPAGFTRLLFALQSGMTIATACAAYAIIAQVTASRAIGFCLSLWFLLSTDLLVMENVFFGQAFSENLAMLFVTLSCKIAVCGAMRAEGRRPRDAFLAGLFATLAALTRSSLSYFVLIPIVAAWPHRRMILMLAFLAPVVFLQGGWMLKNEVAFGHLAWETSIWGGYSAAKGLAADGQGHLLCDDVAAAPSGSIPAWFANSLSSCPYPFANSADAGMPLNVQSADAASQIRLGGANPQLNTIAARLRSDAYKSAVIRYGITYPRRIARRFVDLYPLFWQRIGDYGAKFIGVFVVQDRSRGFFDLPDRGFHENQRIEVPQMPNATGHPSWRKGVFWTVSLAPLDAAAIITLHGIFPLLALIDISRRVRRRAPLLPAGSWMLAGTVAYGLIVFNAVDAGENNRFRLAIEPAIIALTGACLTVLWRNGVDRARRFYLLSSARAAL